VEVEPLGRRAAAAIAVPKKDAAALEIQSRTPLPAGLYEVRLTLRSSHAHEPVSFHSRVACVAGNAVAGRWEASAFALSHQPEIRTTRIAHRGRGPLAFSIRAEVDEEIVAKLFEKGNTSIARFSDTHRSMLLSATRLLQTSAAIAQVEREREELRKMLANIVDKGRFEVLKELQEA
jgi:hypothetical protein